MIQWIIIITVQHGLIASIACSSLHFNANSASQLDSSKKQIFGIMDIHKESEFFPIKNTCSCKEMLML